MGIHDELKKMGYRFEYERGDSEERTEVWINESANMAVRIEWMRIDGEGWYQDGDTYETQEVDVQRDLDVFWADLVGPDESWRLSLLDATGGARHDWRTITISRDGSVSVALADGSTKSIQPPVETPSPGF